MNLTGIVAVTGKSGLYKVLGQNKAGFILEALDEQKTKQVINPNTRIATLSDITIFGTEEELRLQDVFAVMKEKEPDLPVPEPKSDSASLKAYFKEVAPDYDEERVYTSDMKKIISWYKVLSVLPLFEEADPAREGEHKP